MQILVAVALAVFALAEVLPTVLNAGNRYEKLKVENQVGVVGDILDHSDPSKPKIDYTARPHSP
jgi:hypothetical protein